jgi:hypothetical protein
LLVKREALNKANQELKGNHQEKPKP